MDPGLVWLKRLWRHHYRANPVYLPPRFTRREYGFLWFDRQGMLRHKGFLDREDLVGFLAKEGPAHAYYSTAYYERPGASTMKQKGWKGADLIFDLDADHLPGAEGQPFPVILRRVRDEAVHVVEEFLLRHFGLDESDLRIFFSGGRGYHIHVTHPDILPLDAHARREIVAYVTGNGLDVDRLVRKRAVASRSVGGHQTYDEAIELPDPDDPGWPGLVARTLERQLARIAELDDEDARGELESYDGVGPKRATEALEALRGGASARDVAARLPVSFSRAAIGQAALGSVGEVDEPVTADIKRLIRLPGSLHGKTGLCVTPISVSELHEFDPFEDAVALPDDPVTVELEAPATVGLAGNTWELDPGRHTLPAYAAAFLVLRRKATFVGEAA